jgi:[ribosomal protein S18]-alanine N-acetyltransferase
MPSHIRDIKHADLPSIMAVEHHSHEFAWSEMAFKSSFTAQHWMQAVFIESELQAYAVIAQGPDDWELLNITTAPAARRQGHSQRLLSAGASAALGASAQRLLLEVRPSNLPALAAYYSFGFVPVSIRKNYYQARTQSGREDALILGFHLSELAAKNGAI